MAGDYKKRTLTKPEWYQQPRESNMAFEAFTVWLEMGFSRTQLDTARALGKQDGYATVVGRWSSEWSWAERLRAFNDFRTKQKEEIYKRKLEEMADRHAKHSQAFEQVLMVPVDKFIKKIKEQADDLGELGAQDLFDLVIQSAKQFPKIVNTERIVKGQPSEISKQDIDHTSAGDKIEGLKIIHVSSRDELEDDA